MSARFVESIAGIRVVRIPSMEWNDVVISKNDNLILCGEINHVRYLLAKVMLKAAMRRDVKNALAAFAQRVGVEYSDTRTKNQTTENLIEGATP